MRPRITRSKTRGPIFWNFLNIVCWNYESVDKEEYKHLLEHLHTFIPCETCKQHYKEYIAKHSIDSALASQESLNLRLVTLHSTVNKMNLEPVRTLDQHIVHNIQPMLVKEIQ